MYRLMVISALIFIIYLSWVTIQKPGQQAYTYLLFLPALLYFFIRDDHRFLRKLTTDYRLFLLTDSFILLIPVIAVSILKHEFQITIQAVIVGLLSIFPSSWPVKNHTRTFPIRWINPKAFEWRAGIRKNGVVIALVWLTSLGMVWAPAVSLFLLWILHAIITSFYQEHESGDLLRTHFGNADSFLMEKVKYGLRYQLILLAPTLFAYSFLHPEQLWIIVAFSLIIVVSLIFTVIIKYSYYDPDSKTHPSSLLQTFGILSFAIPFLLPVPLILSILHYPKAKSKLRSNGITS